MRWEEAYWREHHTIYIVTKSQDSDPHSGSVLNFKAQHTSTPLQVATSINL